jgi:general secretion pathway protein C
MFGIYQINNISIDFVPEIKNQRFNEYELLSKWENLYKTQEDIQEVKFEGKFPPVELKATSVGAKNFALIKINGKSYIVSENQDIQDLKVIEIGKDYIVVKYNNTKKKITFSNTAQTISKKSNFSNVSVSTAPAINYQNTEQNLKSNTISKSEVDKLTADPGIMFTQIRILPYIENGRTRGFRLSWIKPNSLFQKMGLRTGDVLIAINNQEITTAEDAFRILQIIRNAPSFKVTILRNGKMVELNYFIE